MSDDLSYQKMLFENIINNLEAVNASLENVIEKTHQLELDIQKVDQKEALHQSGCPLNKVYIEDMINTALMKKQVERPSKISKAIMWVVTITNLLILSALAITQLF